MDNEKIDNGKKKLEKVKPTTLKKRNDISKIALLFIAILLLHLGLIC